MIIHETDDFLKELKRLPKDIVKLFEKQKVIFQKNWLDSRLHTKRIKEMAGVYSFRITRRYRVLFYFKDVNEVVFFAIGHRKSIYK
jgi:mRNA-degrading endonuclease RelE of RelBE toxin-antitoxin system